MKTLMLTLAVAALAGPARAQQHQSVGWRTSAAVLIDPSPAAGTHVGPALSGSLLFTPQRTLSYFATATVARTDFSVPPDELHRNHGALSVGVRLAPERMGLRVGATLALGVLAWDDVSETDTRFRSGANAEVILVPGVQATLPIWSTLRLTFALRDQVTGWLNALVDPEERDVDHRLVASIGLGTG